MHIMELIIMQSFSPSCYFSRAGYNFLMDIFSRYNILLTDMIKT